MRFDDDGYDIEVIPALKNFIWSNKAMIDAVLEPLGQTLKEVFDFDTYADVDTFPCIMLGNPSFQKRWVAAPFLIEVRYEVPINGFVLHDDRAENAVAIRRMLRAVSDMFEFKAAETLPVSGTTLEIHYHSEPPLDSGSVEYTYVGEHFCRQFEAVWHGYITRNTYEQRSRARD